MPQKKRALIDFDGVIHHDENWDETYSIRGTMAGEVTAGCIEALIWMRNNGFSIWIYSARLSMGYNTAADLRQWLLINNIPFDGITDKKLEATVYIDDNGLRHEDWEKTCETLCVLFGEQLQPRI